MCSCRFLLFFCVFGWVFLCGAFFLRGGGGVFFGVFFFGGRGVLFVTVLICKVYISYRDPYRINDEMIRLFLALGNTAE